jgi:hypothetical protein
VDELDAEAAILLGGWDSRYATTLAFASSGDVAATLIDTNGDGNDVDLDRYERDDVGRWRESGSSSAGEAGSSWSPRLTAACGRARPAAIVEIEYLGTRHPVVTSTAGWWLFVAAATPDSEAVPTAITSSP